MIPTIEYIQQRFDTFNNRFFDGALPPVPVKLSHAKGFLGKITYTRRKQGLFRGFRNENFVLRINARINLPEELLDDTILHEMIHYYIAVNQFPDRGAHGPLFRSEMERVNREGNRHITISHRLTEEQQQQSRIHKTRAVALVHFADGQTGVKVVPNQERHIRYWHRAAMRRFAIERIDWVFTDNDYFARFPSSLALRIFLINTEELELPC